MPEWTVVVPFFNERDALGATLHSLAAQTLPFRLVLVDNGSTDGSAHFAAALVAQLRLDAALIHEPMPGKVSALASGIAAVRTVYVATCDADTWYPPDYLERATALLDGGYGTVHAATAYFMVDKAAPVSNLFRAVHQLAASWLFPFQCHSGGAGQVFLTESLRRVGGFDPARWNYVLEDHEIMGRLSVLGKVQSAYRFCCLPSSRPRNRASVRWTLADRIRYHLTSRLQQPQYFARYLASRLAARGLSSESLRVRES